MAPSLFLLYSTSSIKFYDHLQGVSAYQWFWNYGFQENIDSKYLDSFLFNFNKKLPLQNITTEQEFLMLYYFFNQNNPEVVYGYQSFFDEKMIALLVKDVLNSKRNFAELEYLLTSREVYLL